MLKPEVKRKVVDVWVMKEYDERNSWTKLYRIPCKFGSSTEVHLYSLKPWFVTNKGEVVMSCTSVELLVYNPKRNKLRKVKHSSILWSSASLVSIVDSLVSPDWGNKQLA